MLENILLLKVMMRQKKLLDKYKNIISISNIVIIKEEDLGEKVYLSLFVTSIEDITEYIEVTEEDNIKQIIMINYT